MTINVTHTQVLVATGALLLIVVMWRAGSRRARKAADAARASARGVSLAGRVVVAAAGMGGVQWLAFTRTSDLTLQLVLLAVPNLIAAFVLTRALTVTDAGSTRRRGDRR